MTLTPTHPNHAITDPARMTLAGQAANLAAGRAAFEDYTTRKAANSTRRHLRDLALFEAFLAEINLAPGDLATNPEAWGGITWGIVAAFVRWQLKAGYAVSSVNMRLSTVKVYAKLAAQAGAIPPGDLAMILQLKSYKRTEQARMDDRRLESGLATRRGAKKAQPVSLSKDKAGALLNQPDTPQGRRDRLLLALLLALGLRVGELAALTVADFDLKAGRLTFYRPKVDKVQTHRLTGDSLAAARAYFDSGDAPAIGSVWRQSRKGRGGLQAAGLTTRAICKRIRALGELAGLAGLSPHDLRHYWATQAARNGTPMDRLQDAGGWASLAMPARYIEAAKIANDGVKLE